MQLFFLCPAAPQLLHFASFLGCFGKSSLCRRVVFLCLLPLQMLQNVVLILNSSYGALSQLFVGCPAFHFFSGAQMPANVSTRKNLLLFITVLPDPSCRHQFDVGRPIHLLATCRCQWVVVIHPVFGYVPPIVVCPKQSDHSRALTTASPAVFFYWLPRAPADNFLHTLGLLSIEPAFPISYPKSVLPIFFERVECQHTLSFH